MDILKRQVAEYCTLKTNIQEMTERKNQLEKTICATMDEFQIDVLELPDGKNLKYKIKESLTLSKTKAKKEKD